MIAYNHFSFEIRRKKNVDVDVDSTFVNSQRSFPEPDKRNSGIDANAKSFRSQSFTLLSLNNDG